MNDKIEIFSYKKDKTSTNSNREIIASVKSFLGDSNADVSVVRDRYGKPFVVGCDGVYVSVAHDGELCLVAVADFPVGIDIERKDRAVKRREGIAKRLFCNDEMSFLGENMADADFCEMWVKKEALSKLIGKGVPCMKEKSVFSEDLAFTKHTEYEGYVVYTVAYKRDAIKNDVFNY